MTQDPSGTTPDPSPDNPSPDNPAPDHQAPQYPEPQYPTPQYPAPEEQSPPYPAPQYQSPQYPAPQYQAPAPPPGYGTYQGGPGSPMPTGPGASGPLSPQDERQWGMLAHVIPLIATLITGGFLGFVGSLIVYLLYRDRSAFVRLHAANSLNVQILTAIGSVISFVLLFVLIGFLTWPLVIIWSIVIHVIGAAKANNGETWNPPLVPRIVS